MVELRLLGSFEISDSSGRPQRSVQAQPKRAALLAYLAASTPRAAHRRDTLLSLFWPDADTTHARHALNQAIHFLRAELGSALMRTQGAEEIELDPAHVRCDVVTLRECVAGGRLDEALELYRGELLPGFHIDASPEFDDWLERERRALHGAATEAALALARRAADAGNHAAAVHWARRASAMAPSDEGCAQHLIRALLQAGNGAAARAEYERLAERLRNEFDVAPSRRTAELLTEADTMTPPTGRAHSDPAGPRMPSGWVASATAPVTTVPRRPFLIPLAAVMGVGLLAVVSIAWLTRPPVNPSARWLAIAPFAVATGDTALVRLGQNLVTTIGANMDGVGEIRVTDGIAMLSHARARGYLLSATDAMSIARELRARSVVHGTLVAQGGAVRADAVMYDVSGDGDGAPLARVSSTVPIDSVAALTDSLTWGLLRAVWRRGRPPTPAVASITTRNVTALRQFLEGDRLRARSEMAEASESYRRAALEDTTFWLAHQRYLGAAGWVGLPIDSAIRQRVRPHLRDLPELDQMNIAVVESTHSVADRIARHRRLIEVRPGDAFGWWLLGDFLMHHAPRTGYEVRESIGAWQEAVRLMPGDQIFAEHLTFACLLAADPCVQWAFAHYDSLVRADPTPGSRASHRLLTLALGTQHPGLADSLAAAALGDSAFPAPAARHLLLAATPQRPELIAEWDLLGKAREATFGPRVSYELMLDRIARGQVSAADSAIALRRGMSPAGAGMSAIRPIRLRVLAELQGMLPPAARTAEEALALTRSRVGNEAEDPFTPVLVVWLEVSATGVEARWIAGLNALLRGDSVAFRTQLGALAAGTSANASIAARSLRAIRLGRSGALPGPAGATQRAAAESLLVLERQHADQEPKVYGAFAADRLLASQWLTDAGRYAAADSLLRFTEGYPLGVAIEVTHAIFAPAVLQRSRIAEAQRRTDAAVRFARLFLSAFDMAPSSQQALIDEARWRVTRLGLRDHGRRP